MSTPQPEVRALAFAEPLASAVVLGIVNQVAYPYPEVPTPSDGLLIVVHATQAFDGDVYAQLVNANDEATAALLPTHEREASALIGFVHLQAITFDEAHGWVLELQHVDAFDPAPRHVGIANGFFELHDRYVHGVRKAWNERPV